MGSYFQQKIILKETYNLLTCIKSIQGKMIETLRCVNIITIIIINIINNLLKLIT